MKENVSHFESANAFEMALHQEFRKLQLGAPDKKLRKAISKASKKISAEVKRLRKDLYKKEEKRKKRELKRLQKKQSMKAGKTKRRFTDTSKPAVAGEKVAEINTI